MWNHVSRNGSARGKRQQNCHKILFHFTASNICYPPQFSSHVQPITIIMMEEDPHFKILLCLTTKEGWSQICQPWIHFPPLYQGATTSASQLNSKLSQPPWQLTQFKKANGCIIFVIEFIEKTSGAIVFEVYFGLKEFSRPRCILVLCKSSQLACLQSTSVFHELKMSTNPPCEAKGKHKTHIWHLLSRWVLVPSNAGKQLDIYIKGT